MSDLTDLGLSDRKFVTELQKKSVGLSASSFSDSLCGMTMLNAERCLQSETPDSMSIGTSL